MSAKSPDTTAEAEESMEMLDWEIENDPTGEEEDQKKTLSKLAETDSKLTDLSQELTAVRKDFEEYKATNDAKWETMEQRMAQKRQAEDSGEEGPAAKARGPLGTPAKPYEFSDLFTQAFDTAGSSIKAKSPSGRLLDRATKPKSLLGRAGKPIRPSGLTTKPEALSGSVTKPKDPVARPYLLNQAEEPSYPATESDSGSLDEFDIVSEAGESSGLANGPKAFSGPTTEPIDRATKAEAFAKLLFRAEQELGLSTEPKELLGLTDEPEDTAARPYQLAQAEETLDPAAEDQDLSDRTARPSGLTTEPKECLDLVTKSENLATEPKELSGCTAKPNRPSGLTTEPKDPAAKPKGFSAPPTQAEETLDPAAEAQDLSDSSAQPLGPTTEPKDPAARPKGFSAPPTQAQDTSDPATEPKDTPGCPAKPKALSGSTIEPSSFSAPPTQAKETSNPAPPPQDPLTQKIANLEAALHSKTSQISRMEQEHKETVLLMSEQLENIYERLNPDSQALDPQEVRDARIETLEERNQELQSIIQANAEEVERAQTQRDGAHAVLLAENYDLKADLKKANEEIEALKGRVQMEREARVSSDQEVERLKKLMGLGSDYF